MNVVVSAIAAAATITFGVLTALRSQYDRVLNTIDFISSAQISEARHRLGLVAYGEATVPEEEVPDRVADLFTVLWAFGRVNAVRQSLPSARLFSRITGGPGKLLRTNIEPWVQFWNSRLSEVSEKLNSPDTAGSDAGLTDLAAAWRTTPHRAPTS